MCEYIQLILMIHSSDYHKSTALSFHLVIIIVYVSVSYQTFCL